MKAKKNTSSYPDNKKSSKERCSWCVALTRFLAFLAIMGIAFCFFCVMLLLAAWLCDTLLDSSIVGGMAILIQRYPALFSTFLSSGFLLIFLCFTNGFEKSAVEKTERES